ncbi:MAG: FAD-dependent oxidoreductase [Asticcacaulis sp.]
MPDAPRLEGDISTDVLVIGSGIAGLSCAYELMQTGRQVTVIDRSELVSGQSARTTAHLSYACDDYYTELIKVLGGDAARHYYNSQKAAVDRIETIITREDIDCDFARVDAYLFPAKDEDTDYLKDELKACHRIGFDETSWADAGTLEWTDRPALKFPRQARFHPLKYLRALIEVLQKSGVSLYAGTPVTRLDEDNSGVTAITPYGVVQARQVVVATNSPFHLLVSLHTKQAPYRTYAAAFKVPKGTVANALYWDTEEPGYHYVRLQPEMEHDLLIIGGEDHKSGDADDGEGRLAALEHWARERWPDLGRRVTGWSGQVYEPADYVPYIGRSPGFNEVYLVTGDSGEGITTGVLAGLMLRDQLNAVPNPWEALYDPNRKPRHLETVGEYLTENLTVVKGMAEQVLKASKPDAETIKAEISDLNELAPSQGAIYNADKGKVAAYRDAAGEVHLMSAKCTHAGCIIHWNEFEHCWDCPCHGSQFATDGRVLNGPASTPLAAVEK